VTCSLLASPNCWRVTYDPDFLRPGQPHQASPETHPLTWRLRDDGEPVWLDEYQAKNGYAAARKALADMSQDDIVQTVKDSGLKDVAAQASPLA
jgi:hypothetical protein